MIIRFLKKYKLEIAVCIGAFVFFAFGFLVGKWQKEQVPVFIEKETTTSTAQTEDTSEVEFIVKQEETEQNESVSEYTEMTVIATAYCPCEECCGEWAETRPVDKNGNSIVCTASGALAKQGRTVAVDPSVFPYGTEIVIDGHTYIAEDCGGAINGTNIDIFFDNHEDALSFGRKEVTILVKGDF